MSYKIERIDLYIREIPPARMVFALGRLSGRRTPTPQQHVRIELSDSEGNSGFGCAADLLSVRWLDKRPGRDREQKLREIVDLIETARSLYLDQPEFESPFDAWRRIHSSVISAGRASGQEDLTSAFVSALFERALLDGVARLRGKTMFELIRDNEAGIQPQLVHPELAGFDVGRSLPPQPRTRFHIRHTVGLVDPLTEAGIPDDERLNDGLPESLEEYVRADGVRYFKVKISGDPQRDRRRLEKLWDVVPQEPATAITLDANEAYEDLDSFLRFVNALRQHEPGLFDHILFIEQPLPRALTHEPEAARAIRKVSQWKPVVIDEADAHMDSFKRAYRLGYSGTSHKNCKGFYKSLLNRALIHHLAMSDQSPRLILSGEDLSNLPIVPLHQDFAALSILDIEHCERNGHHYRYGLSYLSPKDKTSVARRHTDLYQKRGDEWFLRINDGMIDCGSLQCPGFGVADEPDWESMDDMRAWLRRRLAG